MLPADRDAVIADMIEVDRFLALIAAQQAAMCAAIAASSASSN